MSDSAQLATLTSSILSNPFRPLKRQMAGPTRLELATSGVTGQRSNRTELRPRKVFLDWAVEDLNLWHSACKTDTLPAELTAQKGLRYKIQYFRIKVNSEAHKIPIKNFPGDAARQDIEELTGTAFI